MIDIFRKNGTRMATAFIENTASIKTKMMDDGVLSCTIKSDAFLEFKRGDYVEIDGQKFHVFKLPKCTMNHKGEYVFDCEMHTMSRAMDDTLLMFLDKDTKDRIYQSTTEYDLTATIGEFLALIVANMNRVGKGWSFRIDTGVDKRKTINVSIQGTSCKEALKRICDEFEVEWECEGQEIRVATRIERKTAIEFSYPHNLISPFEVERGENDTACTRLYVFGGNRNIPSGYNQDRTNRLAMPNFQQYIERTDTDHIIEKVKTWDDIYPRRNSTITRATMSQAGFFFVTDETIDFDLLADLTDKTAKIAFTDGLLVGYEFEIASYNQATKTIEIKTQQDSGVNVPNVYMAPKAGDAYVLLDINLPQSYIDRAERELKQRALEYFNDECMDEIRTTIKPSQIWLQSNGIKLKAGDMVHLSDKEMGIDTRIRINEVTDYPYNFRTQEIELSNFRKKTRLERLQTAIDNGVAVNSNASRANANIAQQNQQSINSLNNDTQWHTMED